jgi:predicted nucleic acid-binding protein
MIVFDTSAFISLAIGGALEPACETFDVLTTKTVLAELDTTADYDDIHAQGAKTALALRDQYTVIDPNERGPETSQIDEGEASCIGAVRERNASFLITDDFGALPELQQVVSADVALSPIILRALIERQELGEDAAETSLETIAENRDWLGAPIYRYAQRLFEHKQNK